VDVSSFKSELDSLKANGMPELYSKVRKISGDYEWDGVVVGLAVLPNGLIRFLVAHEVNEGYVLHVYSAKQLKIIDT
jgi:hypothetical protein